MMHQRQNFRGRPDNRFRYSAPNRGGRGGFNRGGGGGFQNQRPQHDRQQSGKPNVNEQKGNMANNAGNAPAHASPAITKQTVNVQPLMKKEIPIPVKVDTTPKPNKSAEAVVNKPAIVPPTSSNTKPANKPAESDPAKTASIAADNGSRPGTNQRTNSNFQSPKGEPNQHQGGRQGGPNANQGQGHQQHEQHGSQGQGGRYGGNNRRQHSRFSSGPPPPGQQGGHFQQPEEQQPQQLQQPTDNEFGDELQTETRVEKKFTGRCRLFIGNLPNETTDDDFKRLFRKFGEINEVFLNKQKMFGFIRLDTRLNAEAAKNEMDGATFKGRIIRVRFAAHGAALRVKNLSPVVSNELLEEAFSMFGEVERSIVVVDDRGKSTGEGIVEFARKPAAQAAIKKISEGVFLLTASTRPIVVEPLEQKNDEDGLAEKNVPKHPGFYQEREVPPRFAQRSSFEYEWGQRWKQLAQEEDNRRAQLEVDIVANREKLSEEVELARHDYHTMQMRQELLHRQKELERLEEQRKDLEARRQNVQRQREDRFGGSMGGMGMSEEQMKWQQQQQMQNEMSGRSENMEMQQQQQQSMRAEEGMNRREGGQRQSRFDSAGGAGTASGGFSGNSRSSVPSGALPGQQAVGTMGGNFAGENQQTSMGTTNSSTPRPLMDDLGAELMADFGANAKRQRRY